MSWNAFRGLLALVFEHLERLNPLYVVECFQGRKIGFLNRQEKVLIHCMSWNAFRASCLPPTVSSVSLNPLYVVECFQGVALAGPYKSRVPEGVFLPDSLSTTFESAFFEGFLYKSLIINEVA